MKNGGYLNEYIMTLEAGRRMYTIKENITFQAMNKDDIAQ